MRILFVIGPLRKGGAERVICNLSNELVKFNDVYVATTITSESDYKLDERVKVICLDNSVSKKSFFLRNYSRIKNLRKVIIDNKIDLAISFLPEPSYRLMIAKPNKLKTIISDRNDPNVEYNTFLKKMLTRILYNKASGFVFQTEDAKKWFSRKIQERSVVIPNPINESFIGKPFLGEREKIIVNVGRLTPQKNQKLLIYAFYKIAQKYKDYILKIYGEGPLRSELQNLIEKLDLSNRVYLMGNISNIKEELYNKGIFVLSSDYEGMPNSLMEAMAMGIPCISTDCPIGGPKYLIKNKQNGILVEVNNETSLVEALEFLINNKELAKHIGKQANKICDSLSPKIIHRKWFDYINHIANIEKKGE